jgi:hypothetical protein
VNLYLIVDNNKMTNPIVSKEEIVPPNLLEEIISPQNDAIHGLIGTFDMTRTPPGTQFEMAPHTSSVEVVVGRLYHSNSRNEMTLTNLLTYNCMTELGEIAMMQQQEEILMPGLVGMDERTDVNDMINADHILRMDAFSPRELVTTTTTVPRGGGRSNASFVLDMIDGALSIDIVDPEENRFDHHAMSYQHHDLANLPTNRFRSDRNMSPQ